MGKHIHFCPACEKNFPGVFGGEEMDCPHCGEQDVRATYYVLDFSGIPPMDELPRGPLILPEVVLESLDRLAEKVEKRDA
jgi:hypothetical protein